MEAEEPMLDLLSLPLSLLENRLESVFMYPRELLAAAECLPVPIAVGSPCIDPARFGVCSAFLEKSLQ